MTKRSKPIAKEIMAIFSHTDAVRKMLAIAFCAVPVPTERSWGLEMKEILFKKNEHLQIVVNKKR